MSVILIIAILVNGILMLFLWRQILRTNQVLRQANETLRELKQLESLQHSLYDPNIPIRTTQVKRSREKSEYMTITLCNN